jgi:transposase
VPARKTASTSRGASRTPGGAELEQVIEWTTREGAVVNTEEWKGYNSLLPRGRAHQAVDHSGPKSTWARDDGDGVRAVHYTTQEGLWTRARNVLRRFRGISQ